MRRNPLLYSDHDETEEPKEILNPPKPRRSLFFYFIILANSVLVVFVLGIIWFLFLKSPDLHIKEFSQRFLGATPTQSAPESPRTATVPSNLSNGATDTSKATPSRQEQEEIQQMRLKQMREQEELTAERQRLEKIRAEIEATQTEIKSETSKQPSKNAASANNTSTAIETSVVTAEPSKVISTPSFSESNSVKTIDVSETVDNTEAALELEKEPAVVPNAASETLVPPSNTVDTQVDQIMELMKQQQEQDKKTEEPLNDSRSPSNNNQQDNLATDTSPTISPRLIEKQLEALIETEAMKNKAGQLLKHATDEDKRIQINQKLSKLQTNAV